MKRKKKLVFLYSEFRFLTVYRLEKVVLINRNSMNRSTCSSKFRMPAH